MPSPGVSAQLGNSCLAQGLMPNPWAHAQHGRSWLNRKGEWQVSIAAFSGKREMRAREILISCLALEQLGFSLSLASHQGTSPTPRIMDG